MLSKPAIMKCEKSQHENKVPGLAAPIKSNKTKGLELDGTIKTFLGINKLSAMCAPRPMSLRIRNGHTGMSGPCPLYPDDGH